MPVAFPSYAQGGHAFGLRKAAARRLAEAGCTIHEIASVTGHATLREIQRYTDAADRERLAVKAIASISQMNEAEK